VCMCTCVCVFVCVNAGKKEHPAINREILVLSFHLRPLVLNSSSLCCLCPVVVLFACLFVVLGIDCRALCVVNKHSYH
jgi:hypothetical protein